jgi:hypothetical protein
MPSDQHLTNAQRAAEWIGSFTGSHGGHLFYTQTDAPVIDHAFGLTCRNAWPVHHGAAYIVGTAQALS